MKPALNILVVGDVVGRPGRSILRNRLQGLRDQYRIDLVVANGENSAGGWSITPKTAEELFQSGVDIITGGNHTFDNRDALKIFENNMKIIRPANYPPSVPGEGYLVLNVRGMKVAVVNLMGRINMAPIDCPFRCFDDIYSALKKKRVKYIIVDFHAEATSEKRAFGWYCSGRASAVLGTHTHVQTADEELLNGKTAYITDLGMTGAFDSVIGMNKEQSIERFLNQLKTRYTVAVADQRINAVVISLTAEGSACSIKRIDY